VLHLPERADQGLGQPVDPLWVLHAVALSGSAFAAAVLARASWTFVMSEMDAGTRLAYGIPVWAIQFALPAGFALISVFLGRRLSRRAAQGWALALALLGAGWLGAEAFEGTSPIGTVVAVAMIVAMLLAGAPIFACRLRQFRFLTIRSPSIRRSPRYRSLRLPVLWWREPVQPRGWGGSCRRYLATDRGRLRSPRHCSVQASLRSRAEVA
jgi:hypothetical protein